MDCTVFYSEWGALQFNVICRPFRSHTHTQTHLHTYLHPCMLTWVNNEFLYKCYRNLLPFGQQNWPLFINPFVFRPSTCCGLSNYSTTLNINFSILAVISNNPLLDRFNRKKIVQVIYLCNALRRIESIFKPMIARFTGKLLIILVNW